MKTKTLLKKIRSKKTTATTCRTNVIKKLQKTRKTATVTKKASDNEVTYFKNIFNFF